MTAERTAIRTAPEPNDNDSTNAFIRCPVHQWTPKLTHSFDFEFSLLTCRYQAITLINPDTTLVAGDQSLYSILASEHSSAD